MIATELLLEDSMPNISRPTRSKLRDWSMYFNPTEYWEEHPGLTLENCQLSKKKLLQYGR